LKVFLENPDVPLDTNHLERALRPIPMGRRYVHTRIMCTSLFAFWENSAKWRFQRSFAALHVNIIKDFPRRLISSRQSSDIAFLLER